MTLRRSTGLKNLLLGIATANKISNGAFTTVTTGWTAVAATLTSEASGQAGNCLQVAEAAGAAAGQAYQDVVTVANHLYKFTGYFKKGTSDSGKFLIGTTGDPDLFYDSGALTDVAWTQYTRYFVATAATTRITCQSTDATVGETSFFDTLTLQDMARSVQDIFLGGWIDVYSGTQVSSADAAPTGSLLVSYKKNGTDGVSFDDAVSGVLSKAAAETWQGTVAIAGTPAWFRLRTAEDLGTLNTTDPRVDGVITLTGGGGELTVTGSPFAVGAIELCPTFTITEP